MNDWMNEWSSGLGCKIFKLIPQCSDFQFLIKKKKREKISLIILYPSWNYGVPDNSDDFIRRSVHFYSLFIIPSLKKIEIMYTCSSMKWKI